MLSLGKRVRMSRLLREHTNSCIICALDHGLTSPVFLSGLFDTKARMTEAIAGGAHVFMVSPGFAERTFGALRPDTSLAIMLTASASGRIGGSAIAPIGSVEYAVRLGADAVVVYCALATPTEDQMISYVAAVGEACDRFGMPFIAEAEWPNAYDGLETVEGTLGPEYLKRNARICAELGADIVKVNWSGDAASFAEIIAACNSPVVVAGGSLISDSALLDRFEQAVKAGAIGCSVGRNIFQHAYPEAITRAIARVFRDKWSARQAMDELQEALKSRPELRDGVHQPA